MARKFITADYQATLDLEISLREALPADHLAHFIVEVVAELDLRRIYRHYGSTGAPPYAPEILLALLFYGYATGVFSSRKIEAATRYSIPFRFIAGNLHPDHDTIAAFRKRFLDELKDLFVQILLMAQAMGILELGDISIDGTKIHASAFKHSAVSYKRLLEIEPQVQAEVEALFALATEADAEAVPEAMDIADEIARREARQRQLAEAKAVLAQRAQARYEAEKADYDQKMQERQAQAEATGKKPRGRAPKPPVEGPRDKDQYNFTDPDSRIMKNSTDQGFDQHYNAQVAVDHGSLLVLGCRVSDQANDKQEALPTLDAIPSAVGKPASASLDNGYFSETNIEEIQAREVEPYIATGRQRHHRSWQAYFAAPLEELPEDASPKEKMAYKLKTEVGKAIYRLRKSTVEPVLGIIEEVLGFRQFLLRGMAVVEGEWTLVCLGFNLKRMHRLHKGIGVSTR
jgi:transposase